MELHVQCGWTGSDCSVPALILSSAQITKLGTMDSKFTSSVFTSAKLLYKATRDGFAPTIFHSKCDNKGPLVFIVKANTGALFGAYTSLNWDSVVNSAAFNNACFKNDANTFIFSIISSANVDRYVKITNIASGSNAFCSNGQHGPLFGGGPDLTLSNNADFPSPSYAANVGYENLKFSYTNPGGYNNPYLTGSSYFTIVDMEVFSV